MSKPGREPICTVLGSLLGHNRMHEQTVRVASTIDARRTKRRCTTCDEVGPETRWKRWCVIKMFNGVHPHSTIYSRHTHTHVSTDCTDYKNRYSVNLDISSWFLYFSLVFVSRSNFICSIHSVDFFSPLQRQSAFLFSFFLSAAVQSFMFDFFFFVSLSSSLPSFVCLLCVLNLID